MGSISIGALARETGVAASTIRYYESIGLLPFPRRQSGRRIYDKSAVERVRLIRWTAASGFSLHQIREILNQVESSDTPSIEWPQVARTKLAEIDEQIAALLESRERVRWLADCECQTLRECETRILATCI